VSLIWLSFIQANTPFYILSELGGKSKIYFYKDERIDLRQYVKVKDEYIPTRKGINFSVEWIDKFITMVNKLKDE